MLKPHLWLIRVIGVIVPRRLRADWRQEWEAELQYRDALLARWDKLDWRNKLSLLWHSAGAFMDALWLQPRRWEDEMIGLDHRFGQRTGKCKTGKWQIFYFPAHGSLIFLRIIENLNCSI